METLKSTKAVINVPLAEINSLPTKKNATIAECLYDRAMFDIDIEADLANFKCMEKHKDSFITEFTRFFAASRRMNWPHMIHAFITGKNSATPLYHLTSITRKDDEIVLEWHISVTMQEVKPMSQEEVAQKIMKDDKEVFSALAKT